MLGLLLAVLTGISWALVGVTISLAARRGLHPVPFGLAGSAITLPLLAVFGLLSGDWRSLMPQAWPALQPAYSLPIIVGQTVAGVGGFWILQSAMRRGPNALVWGVGQSAIVFPFVVSIILWDERITSLKVLGLIGVLGCIASSTLQRRQPGHLVHRTWLVLALLSLLAIGVQQSLSLVLSHEPAWCTGHGVWLRIVLGQLLSLLMTSAACWKLGCFPGRSEFGLGAANAGVVLLGRILFLLASDRLAAINLSSVVYPVAVGVCIAGFGLFCWVRLRERLPAHQVAGLIAGAVGVVLLAWP